MTSIMFTAILSLGTAIVVAVITAFMTYTLTKRREHEADWRKLKFGQYQEFVLALSEITEVQVTPARQERYANAVNSMSLVAPPKVLRALREFQNEISSSNKNRRAENENDLLNVLFRALRHDVHPNRSEDERDFKFILLGPPPIEPDKSTPL